MILSSSPDLGSCCRGGQAGGPWRRQLGGGRDGARSRVTPEGHLGKEMGGQGVLEVCCSLGRLKDRSTTRSRAALSQGGPSLEKRAGGRPWFPLLWAAGGEGGLGGC